jgi:NAD(P)-dependent dehydrogenase (short-subunit alcohol dehydrogenase family)
VSLRRLIRLDRNTTIAVSEFERKELLTAVKRNKELTWRRVDPASVNLMGKLVAVVGGTGGIGRAFSRFMASRGARVWVVGQTFRDQGVAGIAFIKADLSLMREAHRVGKALPAESLDLVVLTTGIMAAARRQETAEGLERDLAVSYLSRLVLVREISPRLGTSRADSVVKPRVFVMGFPGAGHIGSIDDLNAEQSYGMMAAHMNTVVGNEVLVLDSARRYPAVNFFGLNPGLVKSNIRSNLLGAGTLRHRAVEWLIGLVSASAETYAERMTPLLVSPDLEAHSGALFNRKGEAILPTPKLTDGYMQRFIAASDALLRRVA